jgi:hypothetical protein
MKKSKVNVSEVFLGKIKKVDTIEGISGEMYVLDVPSLCLEVSQGKLKTLILGVVEDNEYRLLQQPSSSKSFDSIAYDVVIPMFEEWATEHYQSINN